MKQTKLSAGILFTDGKKILLLKRSSEGDNFGKWTIPGGKIENNESLKAGAKRESLEECGSFQGTPFGQYDYIDGKKLFRTYFHAIEKPFKVKLSDEHSDSKWCDLEKVDDLNLHPKFHEVWDYFKQKIRRKFPKNKSFLEWIMETNTKFS